MDPTNAFDHVNRILLTGKLHYGTRDNASEVIGSYLQNRNNTFVRIRVTSFKTVLSGAPHGSILILLSFTLCINDALNSTQEAQFITYADDMTIL